jgi:uncharacterized protein (DUF2164 family)
MKSQKRDWDPLSKERRAGLLREIITHFKTSHDQEIGMLAAEDILDFFLQSLGPDLYRKAINDTRNVVRQNAENLDVDLDLLIHT